MESFISKHFPHTLMLKPQDEYVEGASEITNQTQIMFIDAKFCFRELVKDHEQKNTAYKNMYFPVTVPLLAEKMTHHIVNMFKTRPNLSMVYIGSEIRANVPLNKRHRIVSTTGTEFSLSPATTGLDSLNFDDQYQIDPPFRVAWGISYPPLGQVLHNSEPVPLDVIADDTCNLVVFSHILSRVLLMLPRQLSKLDRHTTVHVLFPLLRMKTNRDGRFASSGNVLYTEAASVLVENVLNVEPVASPIKVNKRTHADWMRVDYELERFESLMDSNPAVYAERLRKLNSEFGATRTHSDVSFHIGEVGMQGAFVFENYRSIGDHFSTKYSFKSIEFHTEDDLMIQTLLVRDGINRPLSKPQYSLFTDAITCSVVTGRHIISLGGLVETLLASLDASNNDPVLLFVALWLIFRGHAYYPDMDGDTSTIDDEVFIRLLKEACDYSDTFFVRKSTYLDNTEPAWALEFTTTVFSIWIQKGVFGGVAPERLDITRPVYAKKPHITDIQMSAADPVQNMSEVLVVLNNAEQRTDADGPVNVDEPATHTADIVRGEVNATNVFLPPVDDVNIDWKWGPPPSILAHEHVQFHARNINVFVLSLVNRVYAMAWVMAYLHSGENEWFSASCSSRAGIYQQTEGDEYTVRDHIQLHTLLSRMKYEIVARDRHIFALNFNPFGVQAMQSAVITIKLPRVGELATREYEVPVHPINKIVASLPLSIDYFKSIERPTSYDMQFTAILDECFFVFVTKALERLQLLYARDMKMLDTMKATWTDDFVEVVRTFVYQDKRLHKSSTANVSKRLKDVLDSDASSMTVNQYQKENEKMLDGLHISDDKDRRDEMRKRERERSEIEKKLDRLAKARDSAVESLRDKRISLYRKERDNRIKENEKLQANQQKTLDQNQIYEFIETDEEIDDKKEKIQHIDYQIDEQKQLLQDKEREWEDADVVYAKVKKETTLLEGEDHSRNLWEAGMPSDMLFPDEALCFILTKAKIYLQLDTLATGLDVTHFTKIRGATSLRDELAVGGSRVVSIPRMLCYHTQGYCYLPYKRQYDFTLNEFFRNSLLDNRISSKVVPFNAMKHSIDPDSSTHLSLANSSLVMKGDPYDCVALAKSDIDTNDNEGIKRKSEVFSKAASFYMATVSSSTALAPRILARELDTQHRLQKSTVQFSDNDSAYEDLFETPLQIIYPDSVLGELRQRTLSSLAEVCDYYVPLLASDFGVQNWIDRMSHIACVIAPVANESWLGLMEWKMLQNMYLRRVSQMDMAHALRFVSTTSKFTVSTKKRYSDLFAREGQHYKTWIGAYLAFLKMDPVHFSKQTDGISMIRTAIATDYDVLRSISYTIPTCKAMNVVITKTGINVYFMDWKINLFRQYVDVVYEKVVNMQKAGMIEHKETHLSFKLYDNERNALSLPVRFILISN